MVVVKLKPADRVFTRVSYYLYKYGLMKFKVCRKADQAVVERIFNKYVPNEIRAAGKMHACLSFDEIRY